MKADSHRPPEGRGGGARKTTGPAAQDKAVQVPRSAPADKVNISGWSRKIADLAAAANQLPDVREDRVRELRQAVESGTYRVDPMKVAIGILREL